MSEFDRALFSIRNHKNDINFRQQPAERLHLMKLYEGRRRKHGDGIRLDGPPESFLQIIQCVEAFDLIFGDHLIDSRRQSFEMIPILA